MQKLYVTDVLCPKIYLLSRVVMGSDLLSKVASAEVLNKSYAWLIKSRKEYTEHNDVWLLLEEWEKKLPQLQQQILSSKYEFSVLELYKGQDETIAVWSALDSLVLKAISIVLGEYLEGKLPKTCVHVKNHGGLKQTVQETYNKLPEYNFMLKSDIRGYYASINQDILLSEMRKLIPDTQLLKLIGKSLKRIETFGGIFFEYKSTSVSLSSPLSPLLAAIALKPLDDAFSSKAHLYYRRFMDDYIILTKTRSHLRRAVKLMWKILDRLRLTIAIDKTYIGRIKASGFNFLGYTFQIDKFTVSNQTMLKHWIKGQKLYERGASREALLAYQRHFNSWCMSGVKCFCSLWIGMSLREIINELNQHLAIT